MQPDKDDLRIRVNEAALISRAASSRPELLPTTRRYPQANVRDQPLLVLTGLGSGPGACSRKPLRREQHVGISCSRPAA